MDISQENDLVKVLDSIADSMNGIETNTKKIADKLERHEGNLKGIEDSIRYLTEVLEEVILYDK